MDSRSSQGKDEDMTVVMRKGSYYENADGKVAGPAVVWCEGMTHPWEVPFDNEKHGDATTLFRDDGRSDYGPNIVREVAAPGFKVEAGKTYVMRNGGIVGPMIADGSYFWAKNGPNPITESGTDLSGVTQYWNKYGAVTFQTNHEECYVIVREHVGDVQTLRIELDAKTAQDIVDAARDEFEKSAEELLKQIADKDAELAAAKDAFNISRDEVECLKGRIRDLEYEVRNKDIETVRLNNLSVLRKDLNDALRKQNARIMSDNRKMGDSMSLAWKEVDELEGVVKSYEAHNETLRRDNRQLFQTVIKVSAWKDRGDERLRKTRRRLKGAKDENVKLVSQYNHMIRTGAFFAKAAEYGMGAVLLAMVFGAGYAIPALFL